jgi:hypothetical protein
MGLVLAVEKGCEGRNPYKRVRAVTSPLMAAAWVETVMTPELCNSMEAVDSRQQFQQTSARSWARCRLPLWGGTVQ